MPKDKTPAIQRYTKEELLAIKAHKVEGLREELMLLSRKINRPYAMLLSILLFPPLIYFLLAHEHAPLRAVFYGYLEPFFKEFFTRRGYTLLTKLDKDIKAVNLQWNQWVDAIRQMKKMKNIDPLIREANDFMDMLGALETISARAELANGDNFIQALKKRLFEICNGVSAYLSIDGKGNCGNIDAYSLPALFKHTQGWIEELNVSPHNYYEILTQSMPLFYVHFAMYLSLTATQVALALPLQFWVVDPILHKFCANFDPNLDFERTPIGKLEAIRDELLERSDFNTKVARYLLILTLAYCLYVLNHQEIPGAGTLIFLITLMGTASSNLYKDAKDYYASTYLDSELRSRMEILNEATKKISLDNPQNVIEFATITESKGINLTSSHFELKFKTHTRPNEEKISLSGKKVSEIFRYCCFIFDMKINFHRGAVLILKGNEVTLSPNKAKKLNELFEQNIARNLSLRILKEQLIIIQKKLKGNEQDFLQTPSHDEKNLSIATFELRFPSYPKELNNLFLPLFAQHKVKIEQTRYSTVMTVTGFAQLESDLLENTLKGIKNILQYANPSSFWASKNPMGETIPRNPEFMKNKEVFSSVEGMPDVEATNEDDTPVVVKFKSCQYDSSKEKNDVYPVSRSKTHDNAAMKEARIFIRNRLQYEQALKKVKDEGIKRMIIKKIEDKIPHMRLGRDEREQVLVPCDSVERNQYGEHFLAKAKIKFLGAHGIGKIRLLCSTETSDKGHKLFNVDGIIFDHDLKQLDTF